MTGTPAIQTSGQAERYVTTKNKTHLSLFTFAAFTTMAAAFFAAGKGIVQKTDWKTWKIEEAHQRRAIVVPIVRIVLAHGFVFGAREKNKRTGAIFPAIFIWEYTTVLRTLDLRWFHASTVLQIREAALMSV